MIFNFLKTHKPTNPQTHKTTKPQYQALNVYFSKFTIFDFLKTNKPTILGFECIECLFSQFTTLG